MRPASARPAAARPRAATVGRLARRMALGGGIGRARAPGARPRRRRRRLDRRRPRHAPLARPPSWRRRVDMRTVAPAGEAGAGVGGGRRACWPPTAWQNVGCRPAAAAARPSQAWRGGASAIARAGRGRGGGGRPPPARRSGSRGSKPRRHPPTAPGDAPDAQPPPTLPCRSRQPAKRRPWATTSPRPPPRARLTARRSTRAGRRRAPTFLWPTTRARWTN